MTTDKKVQAKFYTGDRELAFTMRWYTGNRTLTSKPIKSCFGTGDVKMLEFKEAV